jgi:hypothetical protein
MCRNAYSPDLNPIEDFFVELKGFLKKQWHEYENTLYGDFQMFFEWCVGIVGGRERSAKGHFRHRQAVQGNPVDTFQKCDLLTVSASEWHPP